MVFLVKYLHPDSNLYNLEEINEKKQDSKKSKEFGTFFCLTF
jgi:hypothetical protein